jgi:hypothetical protein
MAAEQLRVTAAAAFVLKIAAALLITFVAILILVQAEIYFSHPLMTHDHMRELF